MDLDLPIPSKEGKRDKGKAVEEESSELARFRAEWRAEVDSRRRQQQSAAGITTIDAQDLSPPPKKQPPQHNVSLNKANPRESTLVGPIAVPRFRGSHPAIKDGALVSSAANSPALDNALVLYKKAIAYEQNRDMDAALAAYRQAFRLNPDVDRAFRREELLQTKLQSYTEKLTVADAGPSSPPAQLALSLSAEDNDHDHLPVVPTLTSLSLTRVPDDPSAQASRLLAHLIKDHDARGDEVITGIAVFEAEDEKRGPVLLNRLPTEVLYLVLRKLDVANLERFARVCWRARVLTLDPGYWSSLVRRTYKPPQLPTSQALLLKIQKHHSNFRQLYIEEPRVRLDGVYIAICHYTRPGLSENSWVNINHFITYYRYLRFYPNGQALSLLTNEEMGPAQVIPILKPTLRMKGFLIGNWYLSGTTLNVVNLLDASGKYDVPGHDDDAMVASSIAVLRPPPSQLLPDAAAGTGTGAGESSRSSGVVAPHRLEAGAAAAASLSSCAASSSTSQQDNRHPQPHAPTSSSASASASTHRGGRHSHSHRPPHHSTTNNNNATTAGTSGALSPRHLFDMALELRSKPQVGRWNRLEFVRYESVNLETGDVHAIPLRNERAFWFSRVRSYGVGL